MAADPHFRCMAHFFGVIRVQAYIPAQQPSAGQDSRVPVAHAHPRRPVDHVVAPPQGPRAAVCLSAVVLSAAHRMRRRREFSQAVRGGRRASTATLVVHLAASGDEAATRVGFVVSKQVGNSVVRHRVARRLRGLMAGRLQHCPSGRLIVVRALPRAADESAELAADLDRALTSLVRKEAV